MSDQIPELAKWAGEAAGAGLSATLAWNVLGPPSRAIGRRLERSVDEFDLGQIGRVVRSAGRKVPNLATPGQVPARVLARVLDEAEWVDEEILVEYLGGVLASSRSPEGLDDRGVTWVGFIRDMSAYALKMHYVIYTCARRLYPDRVESITDGSKLHAGRMFIPEHLFMEILDVADESQREGVVSHCVFRLHSLGLIADGFAHSDEPTFLQTHGSFPQATEGGLCVTATASGVELYMWGHGHGARSLDDFLDVDLAFERPEGLEVGTGAHLIDDVLEV
jgi:hypothetical protein